MEIPKSSIEKEENDEFQVKNDEDSKLQINNDDENGSDIESSRSNDNDVDEDMEVPKSIAKKRKRVINSSSEDEVGMSEKRFFKDLCH